jgi:hypothetical protein
LAFYKFPLFSAVNLISSNGCGTGEAGWFEGFPFVSLLYEDPPFIIDQKFTKLFGLLKKSSIFCWVILSDEFL